MDTFEINYRRIGQGEPAYIIAELSANHHHKIEQALELIHLAKEAGADAVKIQTYTAETMTINCDAPPFQIGKGTVWEGKNLYELYGEAYTPWEWTGQLIEEARRLGITLFSSPFDVTALRFLEDFNMPAYKVASFELVDLPLLSEIGACGKPVILSTGMGTLEEIQEAVDALRSSGCNQLALLKCTSAYPAPLEEANLARIQHMAENFDLPVGLSDHTRGGLAPAIAVSLGACIIEKHFTKSRDVPGPDSSFSMEPEEFREMVQAVRAAESSIGSANYALTEKERSSRVFRRSVFAVSDINAGQPISSEAVRIIRPGFGLPPKELENVLGRTALVDIPRGTPISWDLLS